MGRAALDEPWIRVAEEQADRADMERCLEGDTPLRYFRIERLDQSPASPPVRLSIVPGGRPDLPGVGERAGSRLPGGAERRSGPRALDPGGGRGGRFGQHHLLPADGGSGAVLPAVDPGRMSGATRPASFLEEDIGEGDITTSALVPPGARCRARILARQELVLAGTSLAGLRLPLPGSGSGSGPSPRRRGQAGAGGDGPLDRGLCSLGPHRRAGRAQLPGPPSRGSATLTARFVAAVEGLPAGSSTTRKTLPGLRREQKRAVRGGGRGETTAWIWPVWRWSKTTT